MRNLEWMGRALCARPVVLNQTTILAWKDLDHKQQMTVCDTPCPVRAICRKYNDEMQSSGVVAGGRWYPVSGRR